MTVDFARLTAAAENAIQKYLRIRPGEKIIVVYDDSTRQIAEAFRSAATAMSLELVQRRIEETGEHGREPDPETATMMRTFDVVFAPTRYSLTHTNASKEAKEAGSRVATLPGISEDLFTRGMKTDPLGLHEAGESWIRHLNGNYKIRVTTQSGTDFAFEIGQYPIKNDDGCLFEKHILGNLPAGEVFCAPDPLSGEGALVIDGSVGSFPWSPASPSFRLEIRDGRMISYEGERGKLLYDALSSCGNNGLLLAEFGIGTNPELSLSGNLLEDEKVKGTIHFAFGNNCGFGGSNNVPIHIDCLITNPNVYCENNQLMKDGSWMLK